MAGRRSDVICSFGDRSPPTLGGESFHHEVEDGDDKHRPIAIIAYLSKSCAARAFPDLGLDDEPLLASHHLQLHDIAG